MDDPRVIARRIINETLYELAGMVGRSRIHWFDMLQERDPEMAIRWSEEHRASVEAAAYRASWLYSMSTNSSVYYIDWSHMSST